MIDSILKNANKLNIENQLEVEFYSVANDQINEHSHEYFEIFMILKSSTQHFLNGKSQLLKEGDISLIRPGETHYFSNSEQNDCRFVNIGIHPSLFFEILKFLDLEEIEKSILNLKENVEVSVTIKHKLELERKLLNLSYVTERKKMFIGLKVILLEIILLFYSKSSSSNGVFLPEWFEKLLSDFRAHYDFFEGLPKLYKISNKSPEHISRLFRKFLNTTPTTYINDLRLEYARNLLIFSNTRIIDVAMDSGFESISHFHHLFKKKYKLSPKKFRSLFNKNINLTTN